MLLLFHITVALGSLVAAGAVYFKPSTRKLHTTYLLTASMLASGTVLVIRNSAHLVESCILGLSLLTVISYAVVAAKSKLALERETTIPGTS